MRPTVLLAVVPLLIATPALAQRGSPTIDQSGKEFLDFAAEVNQSEIQGRLAAEKKAEDPGVRAFARLMVLDHMALESQLAAVATENGVQLPNAPSEQAKQEMATLQGMSGAKFDAAYMQHMVQGHEQAVQRFKSEKEKAQSQPIEAVVPPHYLSSSSTKRLGRRCCPRSIIRQQSVRLDRRTLRLRPARPVASLRPCTSMVGLPDSS